MRKEVSNMSKKVAIIMGSDSDLPVVKAAISELKAFGVPSEVHVMSAHRTPELVAEFATNAKENGFGVIIAAVSCFIFMLLNFRYCLSYIITYCKLF